MLLLTPMALPSCRNRSHANITEVVIGMPKHIDSMPNEFRQADMIKKYKATAFGAVWMALECKP
jgi:hypothetical protein